MLGFPTLDEKSLSFKVENKILDRVNSKKFIYITWGVLDVIYISWYCIESFRLGKLPYLTDFSSTIDTVLSHGGTLAYLLSSLSWILQVSIIVSAILLILRHPIARILCILQIPLRLLILVPSISVLSIYVTLVDEHSTLIFILLLLLSEGIKFITLWKYK